MKKILLTGVAGFVGSHVLQHLLTNTDWNFVCIASWKHKGTPERLERIFSWKPEWRERVEIITHDIVSPFTEKTKQRIGKVDYIVNVASESHVNRSITDPVPFVKNNVDLVLTMLELAREIKPEKFLQFSTDEVYGVAPDGVNHVEWSPIVPSNPYSASKAAQEAIAISYWRTYGVPLMITNTMNIFGETQDAEKYVAQLINKISKGEKVTVHGSEGNIGSRYYLHARNCADAVLFVLNNVTPSMYPDALVPDRFNVVGDVELDNLTLAKLVASMVGKELNCELVDFHSARAGHDRRYALDGTKLKNLGWKAPVSFEESMRKTVEWTLKNNW